MISSNMKLGNNKCLNTDVQACIEPPSTPLIKSTAVKIEECNIINIKMRRYPASAVSETYELKVQTFENGKPEEFLQIMKYFKTGTDGKRTPSAPGNIQFLRTMLRGGHLREFYVI